MRTAQKKGTYQKVERTLNGGFNDSSVSQGFDKH